LLSFFFAIAVPRRTAVVLLRLKVKNDAKQGFFQGKKPRIFSEVNPCIFNALRRFYSQKRKITA
jgi:hypothetical protein